MGRTSLEKEIARNRNITVRLTETEYDIVRNDAASAGLSISNYCRKQVLKGSVSVQYSIKANMEELTNITRQMFGIGNNLNQIAKYFHTGGSLTEHMQMEISKVHRELNEIRLILEKVARNDYGSSKTQRFEE